MLDTLPNDILFIIFSKLANFDITNLFQVSKVIKNVIKTDYFITYLINRKHPVVFNSHNKYCFICNIHYFRINNKNKRFIQCKH